MATKLDLYRPDFGRRPYWLALLIAIDQLANAALAGYPDETISSRAHREGWTHVERLIDTLFFLDRQGGVRHCELAYYGELVREHFPVDMPA
ncbi:hypothetical protein [Azotobacter vinelandii]|uniref:hypothetical protein n=1 Tax=Azotobacter vinelandii TaxID=354 RepID=UPI00266511C9|nr:hypothetical protein [Azotobacter vinelandii]WKN20788.1 hypothetical protein AVAEIV_003813 [Azotobacter vinelandii]